MFRTINDQEFAALEARVAALESGGGGGGGVAVRHFNTGSNSERVASLPITTDSSAKRVVFSRSVALTAGEVLAVLAEFEVTNPYSYNVMCGKQALLGATFSSVTGHIITEGNARNVTPDMHHDVHAVLGTIVAPSTGTFFVNVVAWAGADTPGAGHALSVEQGYGRLSVLVFG